MHYKTVLEMVTPCKRDNFNLHPVQINEMLKKCLSSKTTYSGTPQKTNSQTQIIKDS